MKQPNEQQSVLVTLHEPLSLDWNKDKVFIEKIAEQPTPADQYYVHANTIKALFDTLTYGTPAQPQPPLRMGLLLYIYDELYPIAFFARLYFSSPKNVVIQWINGNQHHDAIVKYKDKGSNQSDISYLEVTTLQGKEDADELVELSKESTTRLVGGGSAQEKHERKLGQLENILKKKGKIPYPDKTALLVYTDEDRFREFCFGFSRPEIDKKSDYQAVLDKLSLYLKRFSYVFIFSKKEIYCSWSPDKK